MTTSETDQPEATQAQAVTLGAKLKRSRRLNWVLGALSALLLVIAIAQPLSQSKPAVAPEGQAESAAPSQPSNPGLAQKIARADAQDPLAYGKLDAPLTVIEYTDYRCPFCAKFTNQTMPELLKKYVDEGLVRWEIHDVAFFGDESTAAAVAARAAGEQGKFAEFYKTIYAAAPPSGHPPMPKDKLIGLAKQAGVADLDKFAAALDRPDLSQAVTDSTAAAQKLGVTSVPFFVVGGTYFAGAQEAETFNKVIAEQLELVKAK